MVKNLPEARKGCVTICKSAWCRVTLMSSRRAGFRLTEPQLKLMLQRNRHCRCHQVGDTCYQTLFHLTVLPGIQLTSVPGEQGCHVGSGCAEGGLLLGCSSHVSTSPQHPFAGLRSSLNEAWWVRPIMRATLSPFVGFFQQILRQSASRLG